MGEDGHGQGGDGNSPATRDTKGNTATRRVEDMASGQEPKAPPSAMHGTAEGDKYRDTQARTQRHSDGYDCARPKHGAFCKYGLLAPEGSAGDTAAAGLPRRGDEPKETTGTGETKETERGTG